MRVVRSSSDFGLRLARRDLRRLRATASGPPRTWPSGSRGSCRLARRRHPRAWLPTPPPPARSSGTRSRGRARPRRLRALQDWYVKPQLASVPGVAEVASVGGMPIEYQVELDPIRLRSLGRARSSRRRTPSPRRTPTSAAAWSTRRTPSIVVGASAGSARRERRGRFDPQAVLRDLEAVPVPRDRRRRGSPGRRREVALGTAASAGRAGKRRQRGRRRRRPDGRRREPAGGDTANQGARSATFRPGCRRASGSSRSTTARR